MWLRIQKIDSKTHSTNKFSLSFWYFVWIVPISTKQDACLYWEIIKSSCLSVWIVRQNQHKLFLLLISEYIELKLRCILRGWFPIDATPNFVSRFFYFKACCWCVNSCWPSVVWTWFSKLALLFYSSISVGVGFFIKSLLTRYIYSESSRYRYSHPK
jgi:hypothetical protein